MAGNLIEEILNLQRHEKKVVGFHISVDDVAGMQVLHNAEYLNRKVHHQALVHDFGGRLPNAIVDVQKRTVLGKLWNQ